MIFIGMPLLPTKNWNLLFLNFFKPHHLLVCIHGRLIGPFLLCPVQLDLFRQHFQRRNEATPGRVFLPMSKDSLESEVLLLQGFLLSQISAMIFCCFFEGGYPGLPPAAPGVAIHLKSKKIVNFLLISKIHKFKIFTSSSITPLRILHYMLPMKYCRLQKISMGLTPTTQSITL